MNRHGCAIGFAAALLVGGPAWAAGNDTSPPHVTLVARTLKVDQRGFFHVRLACPSDESACTGRLEVTARTGRGPAVRVAHGHFTIAGGKTQRLELRLGRRSRHIVATKGKLKATAFAVAHDAAGNRGITKTHVKLKRAR